MIAAGRLTVVGAIAMSSWAPTPQRSQQPPPPTFRTGVELIRIDAVVVDADGRSIYGLTQDDFQIRDRGELRPVATFREVTHERPEAPVLPPTLRLDVGDNSTARSDRLVVLVLDDLSFRDKTDVVKDMARKVVSQLGPQASLALVTTSGTFGVEPTEDRALLLAEIDRFIDTFDPHGKKTRPTPLLSMPKLPAPPGIERVDPGDLALFFGEMSQYRTLQDVSKMVGLDEGRRKAFVWISGSNTGGSGLAGELLYPAAESGMLEALRKGNVTAYPIATGDFGSGLLQRVADHTGGFVTSARDFDAGLDRLIEDLDHYYLLGFYPPAPTDRAYHALEVTVNRPGAQVRHRRGYQAGAKPAPPKNNHPLENLSANVLPAVDLPLRITATPTPAAGRKRAGLGVVLEVRTSSAALLEADGRWRDRLQYAVWAVDLDQKQARKTTIREARFTLEPTDPESAKTDIVTYQIHTSLELPPGRYQLRASASSAKLKAGGSVFLEVAMPDFKASPLQLGALLLARTNDDPRLAIPVVSTSVPADRMPFTPTLDRVFPREAHLRVFCDVARPAGAVVDVAASLLDANGIVVRVLNAPQIRANSPGRIDLEVPLLDLAPGGYVVRITASTPDGQHTATRETGFVVR